MKTLNHSARSFPFFFMLVCLWISALRAIFGVSAPVAIVEEPTGRPSSQEERLEFWRQKMARVRDVLPAPVLVQQRSAYERDQDITSVTRSTLNPSTGEAEEFRAEFPGYNPQAFSDEALSLQFDQFQVGGFVYATNRIRYRWNEQTHLWDQEAWWKAPLEAVEVIEDAWLDLDGYPGVAARRAAFEDMRKRAHLNNDRALLQIAEEQLTALDAPGSRYFIGGFNATNDAGQLMRFFMEANQHEIILDKERRVLSAVETDAAGHRVWRVDNRFETAHNFLFPSADRIGDIHPFNSSSPPTATQDLVRSSFRAIGVVYSRVDGAWRIDWIRPESPAEAAGLRVGDILAVIQGKKTTGLGLEDFSSLIDNAEALSILVHRGQDQFSVAIQGREYSPAMPPGFPQPYR
jgi:hypothetical protein